VKKLILHLKAHNIPMAVATSSRREIFELKTAHLSEIFDCFEGKVVCGDDKQWIMRGKPEPDIFLVAAREVLGRDVGLADANVKPSQIAERRKGLVFEDAIPGMQAGKRAGMSGAFEFKWLVSQQRLISSSCLGGPGF
jgi:pseudouridine-5'-monophosphatase